MVEPLYRKLRSFLYIKSMGVGGVGGELRHSME